MYNNQILKNNTLELLEGAKELEESFTDLTDASTVISILTTASDYFDRRSEDCDPLIENCDRSLKVLPKFTPRTSKINRKQFDVIRDRLERLKISFIDLQESTDTITSTSSSSAEKATAAGEIVLEVPSIIKDFIFMKLECKKVKNALNF